MQGLWHWELSTAILHRRFQLTHSAILPTAKDDQWKGEGWIPECPKVGTEHSLLRVLATPKEKELTDLQEELSSMALSWQRPATSHSGLCCGCQCHI